jgi:hypothetical protein
MRVAGPCRRRIRQVNDYSMTRFIIAGSDSGAGALKRARVTGRIVGVPWRLAGWPASNAEGVEAFFSARLSILSASADRDLDCVGEDGGRFARALDQAIAHDRLELWFDPDIDGRLAPFVLL